MGCQVILELRAAPGRAEDIRAWLKGVLHETRSFEGCVTLHAVQNQEDPDIIVLVEQWDTRQHYERYLAWRVARGDMARFSGMMAGPPIIRFFDFFGI